VYRGKCKSIHLTYKKDIRHQYIHNSNCEYSKKSHIYVNFYTQNINKNKEMHEVGWIFIWYT
jgi:hypothetical protein